MIPLRTMGENIRPIVRFESSSLLQWGDGANHCSAVPPSNVRQFVMRTLLGHVRVFKQDHSELRPSRLVCWPSASVHSSHQSPVRKSPRDVTDNSIFSRRFSVMQVWTTCWNKVIETLLWPSRQLLFPLNHIQPKDETILNVMKAEQEKTRRAASVRAATDFFTWLSIHLPLMFSDWSLWPEQCQDVAERSVICW